MTRILPSCHADGQLCFALFSNMAKPKPTTFSYYVIDIGSGSGA
jgi:hypothetical protein